MQKTEESFKSSDIDLFLVGITDQKEANEKVIFFNLILGNIL